jgi:hypothetical protein
MCSYASTLTFFFHGETGIFSARNLLTVYLEYREGMMRGLHWNICKYLLIETADVNVHNTDVGGQNRKLSFLLSKLRVHLLPAFGLL